MLQLCWKWCPDSITSSLPLLALKMEGSRACSPQQSLDPAHATRFHLRASHGINIFLSLGQDSDTRQAAVSFKDSSAVRGLSEDRLGLRHLTSEPSEGVTEIYCRPLGRKEAKGLSGAMWKPLDLNRTWDFQCLLQKPKIDRLILTSKSLLSQARVN